MWRPRPPGLAWLAAHELRIGWRGTGAIRSWFIAILGVLLVAAAHFAGWIAMRHFDLDAILARAAPLAILSMLFIVLFVVSSAFGFAVHALYSRGDLDLLLSSPVPVSRVYAIRAAVVGLGAIGTISVFVLPIANMAPFHGHWGPLAAYPVLVALGLGSAAIAFASTFALVRIFGVRRARVMAQVAGALIGAAIVIVMQARTILPRSTRERIAEWAQSDAVAWWVSAGSPLTWPLRAMAGEPGAAVTFVAFCLALFVVLIRATTRNFAAAAQQAPEAPARVRSRKEAARGFRRGLARVVVAKELTLIARDPGLIAQVLLQMIYLVPLFFILMRKAQPPALMASGLIMLAMSLAGSFAWMTVSGEEAPDLLGSAPISLERTRWLKVAAALIPVAVLVLPFVAWFAVESLLSAWILALCLAGGLVSAAVVQVWTGQPTARRDLRLRHKQGFFISMAELFSAIGWSVVCYFAITRNIAAMWGVPLALLSPAAAWITARRRRNRG